MRCLRIELHGSLSANSVGIVAEKRCTVVFFADGTIRQKVDTLDMFHLGSLTKRRPCVERERRN